MAARRKILVVDDEPDTLELVRVQFTTGRIRRGYC